jgi:hypothetical protein
MVPLSPNINIPTIDTTNIDKSYEGVTTFLNNQIESLQNSISQGSITTNAVSESASNQNSPTEINLNDKTFNYDDIKNQLEQLNQNLISSQSLTNPQNLLVQEPTTPTVVTQFEQLITDIPKLSENAIENIRNQFSQTNTEQNLTNINNKIGNTITEIPALQTPEMQSLISPSPAAINPLEIPKVENLMTNNNFNYGGEVKISHEMEIKVSSTDGKLKGDELGKLLKDEIKRNNQLAGEIGRAINGADLGALKKPGAISEPQFT